jgi:diacylglycerol O-acyltransferase / trehalose O-mycolyltransferase
MLGMPLRRWAGRVTVVVALLSACSPALSWSAVAAPYPFSGAEASSDGSHLDHAVKISRRHWTLYVYSAAMNRVIGLRVLRPAGDAPAPTLYLLDGAEDGIGRGTDSTWETRTKVDRFFADKHVNIVTIIDGKYSYYTNWLADDPVLGRNEWTTFLTRELPPILNSALHTTGRNAIAGVSMSATSVLALAEDAPKLYSSVGSFSGCDETSTDPGRRFVEAVVLSGGGNPVNMWGPDGSPEWAANDPSTPANLIKLRGINLEIAAGNGAPGPYDHSPIQTLAPGAALERTVQRCTIDLQQTMHVVGVPATFRLTPFGTHSWPYWQADLYTAWSGFATSLGLG